MAMARRTHLTEFAATVTGEAARNLLDTYQEALSDPTLSQAEIVLRLRTAMEAKLEEPANAPPPTVDH